MQQARLPNRDWFGLDGCWYDTVQLFSSASKQPQHCRNCPFYKRIRNIYLYSERSTDFTTRRILYGIFSTELSCSMRYVHEHCCLSLLTDGFFFFVMYHFRMVFTALYRSSACLLFSLAIFRVILLIRTPV